MAMILAGATKLFRKLCLLTITDLNFTKLCDSAVKPLCGWLNQNENGESIDSARERDITNDNSITDMVKVPI